MSNELAALIMGLLIAGLGYVLGRQVGWAAHRRAEQDERDQASANIDRAIREWFG
ncbi:MAG TPA: hypothetical protein VIH05_08200 [Tepidiformaceae bacterium]